MYLSSFCNNSRCLYTRNSNKLLSSLYLNQTTKCSITRLSTTVLDKKKRSILSNSIGLNIHNTRHSHDGKLFSLEKLGIPKKLIGWQERLLLKWKLGNQFDAPSFFDGVMGTFVYVTECVCNGEDGALQDLLTDNALQAVTEYITDAKNDRDPYQVEEKDIVVVKVTAVDFEPAEEYHSLRNVTVLSIYVWIAYMRDCLKVLESSNPGEEETWSNIAKKLGEMQKSMHELSHHAEFKFQRAYDQKLENPLTDWVIAAIAYKIPKRNEE